MIRKIVIALLSGILAISLVACNNKEEKKVEEKQIPKVTQKEVPGEWSKNYSKEEVTALHKQILQRVEDLVAGYGLEYKKEEKVKEEKGETVNDNYIYVDNLNPEPNRMESMYYGFKMYGTDMSQGALELKIGFNLDVEQVKSTGDFNFGDTSLAAFSKSVTGVENRDYTELNKQIYEAVSKGKQETIENNLDGLVETITIKDKFLLYKIDSKRYEFKK
ncbi:hypothetical protein JCM1393_17820 [Clostridium carnis]